MNIDPRFVLVLVLSCWVGGFLNPSDASAQSELAGVTVTLADSDSVSWQEPQPDPPTQPPTLQPQPPEPFRLFDRRQGTRRTGGSLNQTQSRGLLASRNMQRAPDMFGDIFGLGGQIFVNFEDQRQPFALPLTMDSRRVKVAENNRALPGNRVFFLYNHFHNALEAGTATFPSPTAKSVDRYTFGIENLIFNDLWSVEVRMPFSGTSRFGIPDTPIGVESGKIGNLALIVKHLVYQSEDFAVALGLGIDLPTAEDVHGRTISARSTYHIDAVHLLPYAGFLYAPNDRWFLHGFAQVDLATGGNRVEVVDLFSSVSQPPVVLYNEQNLFYLDASAGRWIYRNPTARVSGVAVTGELHYTSALQDSDFAQIKTPSGSVLTFFNAANRFDILNATIGLNVELGPLSNLRVGAVLPLRTDRSDRAFDAEVQVSATRRY